VLLAQLRQRGVFREKAQSWSVRGWAMLAGGFAAALVVAAVLIDQLPNLALPFVGQKLERGWSSGIEAVISAESRVCPAGPGQVALERLLARLASAASIAHTPIVSVLDSKMVNAFTLPDGRILVLQGLIAKAEDADELSGVLAHELGHVQRRDPTRAVLRRLELNMLGQSLGLGGDVAGQMAALTYGRRAEAEADASALRTLRRAGLRADGLSRFFNLLETSERGNALPAFLSDHPATADRAAALKTPPGGLAAMPPADWSSVRTMCQGAP
jgi:Zn-dependent protease with chaperone function